MHLTVYHNASSDIAIDCYEHENPNTAVKHASSGIAMDHHEFASNLLNGSNLREEPFRDFAWSLQALLTRKVLLFLILRYKKSSVSNT